MDAMPLTLYLAAALAGAAYTLTPGPAFLALLGIGAGQGRRAGVKFLAGHFAGDIVWGALALVAIIGSASLGTRSEEHTSELQSLMRISYAVFCLKKKNTTK